MAHSARIHIPFEMHVAQGLHRFTAVLISGWQAYWRGRARRATVRLLQSLDDRALHDLGMDRSEIGSVVYGEAGERRSTYRCGCR
jgi:uncharacterized protein YjiS (DUF1127 family)